MASKLRMQPTMKLASRLALLTALLIAGNLASACSHSVTAPSSVEGSTAGSTALSTNTLWTLRSLQEGTSPEITIADPSKFTLTLTDDGKIQVRADCNRGIGGYTVTGQTLSVGPMAVTRAYCGDDSVDNEFLTLLSGENTLTSAATTLQLSSPRGTLRFAR